MAALHLVNKTRALPGCLQVAAAEDTVLLLEEAVYAGTVALAPERNLLALQADVVARGLGGRLGSGVSLVSDADFVALVVEHEPIVSWR